MAVRATAIDARGMRCDERYMQIVHCGGKQFLFSRRDYQVKNAQPDEPSNAWQTMVHPGLTADTFGQPYIALRMRLKMSHNAVFLCARGTLVALGGQSYKVVGRPLGSRDELGIMRSEANATHEPLRWSTPRLVISGDPHRSGCVEARCLDEMREVLSDRECAQLKATRAGASRRLHCEYDGKLSVATLRGRLLLFSRSNLYAQGGRHVQVALGTAADGSGPFAPFEQIVIEGYKTSPANNLYFASVRRVGTQLLGLFPGVVNSSGGIWCSTSTDGVHWRAPLRVWRSAVWERTRTRDWPVEGGLDVGTHRGSHGTRPLSIVIEHNVYLSLGGFDYFETLCKEATLPWLREYRIQVEVPSEAHHADAGDNRVRAPGRRGLCASIAVGLSPFWKRLAES
jgi:hypothetical protein